MRTRVSLAELVDSGILLRSSEAAAIVRELCRQHATGELRGIPNPTVIRLTLDGQIVVEGPVSRDQDPVRAAAALLTTLLPGFDSPRGFKVPGGLRLVLARATRTLDLPPFAGLPDFAAAIERFASPDLGATVRRLFTARVASRPVALPLPSEATISDVRRARRATGLSLEEVAYASGVPATRLRELEWGYLRNWTADERGREELERYARAAGLDEAFVVPVAWPLVEAAAAEAAAERAPEPAALPVPAPAPSQRREPHLLRLVLTVAAIVALVAAALVLRDDSMTTASAAGETAGITSERPLTDARAEAADAGGEGGIVPIREVIAEAPPELPEIEPSSPRPAAAAAPARRPPSARPAHAVKPRRAERKSGRDAGEAGHKSFWNRELLRIVIK